MTTKAALAKIREAYFALHALTAELPQDEINYYGFDGDYRLEELKDYLAHVILVEERDLEEGENG
jgi:hypothetical protein